MAKTPILDDPFQREKILNFCRSCGHETWKGKNCWDTVLSRARYWAYKNEHPDFADQVQEACDYFFRLDLKQHPNRLKDIDEEIERRIKQGVTTHTTSAEYLLKTNEDGTLVLDANNQPIPDRVVGTVKRQSVTRPCSDALLLSYRDKYEKASHQI